jgi:hypothetical protein
VPEAFVGIVAPIKVPAGSEPDVQSIPALQQTSHVVELRPYRRSKKPFRFKEIVAVDSEDNPYQTR